MIVKKLAGDFVLIEAKKRTEAVSVSGIVMKVGDDTVHEGTIRQVGPGLYTTSGTKIPMTFAEGDTVMYNRSSNNKRTINETDYYLVRENSIEYAI